MKREHKTTLRTFKNLIVLFADEQMTVWLYVSHVQSIVADFRYSSPLIIIDYVYIGIFIK